MIKLPQKDELVIVKVNKVMPYGAFCSLLEYERVEGFLHIREVASKWIRNITDYVKPGMLTVARVIDVEKNKNVVDLSLRSVSEDMKRKKIEEYQNEKKAVKIIEVAYKKASMTFDKHVILDIKKDYEMVYDLLVDIQGEEVDASEYFPKKVAKVVEELVKSLIRKPKIEVKAIAEVMVLEEKGIEKIRKGFSKIKADVSYLGAPKYLIKVVDDDYKKASKRMKAIKGILEKEFGKSLLSFERAEKK